MIKEALEFIFSKAEEAANPKPQMLDIGILRKKMILKGQVTDIEIEPKPLTRHVSTIDSLLAVLAHEKVLSNIRQQVFVEDTGITAILDDSDRTERVRMAFSYSSQFAALKALEKPVSQKMLLSALRSALYGCCNVGDIVSIVRKIEFKRQNDGSRSIEHGRESLGRSVESVVQSKNGEIPEELTFRVNLFAVPSDLNSQIQLRYAIELDAERETIQLLPIGDDEAVERQRVISNIRSAVEDDAPDDTLVVSGTVA